MRNQEWDNLQQPKEYIVCDNCQPHFNEKKKSLYFFVLSFTIFPFLIFSYSLHPSTTWLNKEKRCTKWNNAYASTICMHVRCWLKSRPLGSPSLNVAYNECIASAGNTSPATASHLFLHPLIFPQSVASSRHCSVISFNSFNQNADAIFKEPSDPDEFQRNHKNGKVLICIFNI